MQNIKKGNFISNRRTVYVAQPAPAYYAGNDRVCCGLCDRQTCCDGLFCCSHTCFICQGITACCNLCINCFFCCEYLNGCCVGC